MNIGISTACFYPMETERAFERCIKIGARFCEVFVNAECELERPFLNNIKSMADNNGVKIVSLHPFTSIMEPYLLFSRYERRFNDGRMFYKRYYDAAQQLGADILVIHGGRPGAHTTDEVYCERFSIMRADAKEFGVRVCQENVNAYRSQSPEFIKTMRQIMKDDIDFVFDVKQAVRAGYTPEEMMQAMGNRIVHFHLSDHNSDKDCVLPFAGEFDFENLKALSDKNNFIGSGIIEVYNDAYNCDDEIKSSFEKLKKVL